MQDLRLKYFYLFFLLVGHCKHFLTSATVFDKCYFLYELYNIKVRMKAVSYRTLCDWRPTRGRNNIKKHDCAVKRCLKTESGKTGFGLLWLIDLFNPPLPFYLSTLGLWLLAACFHLCGYVRFLFVNIGGVFCYKTVTMRVADSQ